MIENCSDFMDVMAAEVETMALLEALIGADTGSKRVHKGLLCLKRIPSLIMVGTASTIIFTSQDSFLVHPGN